MTDKKLLYVDEYHSNYLTRMLKYSNYCTVERIRFEKENSESCIQDYLSRNPQYTCIKYYHLIFKMKLYKFM